MIPDASAGPAPESRADGRGVLEVVAGLVAELGGRGPGAPVGLDETLDRDLGIGSLERVELLLRLERRFGVRLADAVMAAADTPRALVAAIEAAGPATVGPAAAELVPPGPAVAAAAGAGRAIPASVRTLVEALEWHAEAQPERVHVLLREEDGTERPLTHAALWREASAVAGGLAAAGVDPGETVALLLRTEAAFFHAFFGVLLAGGVPVPVYPPARRDRLPEYADRQAGILRNAGVRTLITFPEGERLGTHLRARVPDLARVTTAARLAATPAAAFRPRHPAPEAPALVQYTSGSTGAPKGVCLSHASVLANIRAIGEAARLTPEDVGVSWLPLYHDMGLIGSWLAALCFGIPVALLSPLAFLARPARWLRAIATHRGTLSAAPNFAYDLCVRGVTDAALDGVDLSSWRVAFNGSEVVSPDTMARFAARFARWGFRPEALCPAYGLAEAAVALTVSPVGRGPRILTVQREPFERGGRALPAAPDAPGALRHVSCGVPVPGHEVRVVGDAGESLPERVEGRIEFRGPSVMAGYYRNPEATRAAVRDGWVDSGDLGYFWEGELVVTGRRKDLIVKGGRNLDPRGIEEAVAALPGVRRDGVAAFGIPDPALGTERLGVVAETEATDGAAREALRRRIVEAVTAALGVPPDVVVVSGPGAVLRTSSGKIRRAATREACVGHGARSGRPLARRPGPRLARWPRLGLALGTLRARAAGALDVAGRLAYTAYAGAVGVVTLPVLWARVGRATDSAAAQALSRRWCRLVFALGGCRLHVEGLEHLRGLGPAVLVANHASYVDTVLLLAALPLDLRFVAKRGVARLPVVSTVVRRAGHLTVTRGDPARSVADAGAVGAALRAGASLLVFPEGTFLRGPGLLPFRLGAFRAAVEARRPVVPVTLAGTREVLPAYAWLLRPGPLSVHVGAPIWPQGEGWREMVRLRDLARAAIARRLGV